MKTIQEQKPLTLSELQKQSKLQVTVTRELSEGWPQEEEHRIFIDTNSKYLDSTPPDEVLVVSQGAQIVGHNLLVSGNYAILSPESEEGDQPTITWVVKLHADETIIDEVELSGSDSSNHLHFQCRFIF